MSKSSDIWLDSSDRLKRWLTKWLDNGRAFRYPKAH